MVSFQNISLLVGGAAATLAVALPGQAEEGAIQAEAAEMTDAIAVLADYEASETTAKSSDFDAIAVLSRTVETTIEVPELAEEEIVSEETAIEEAAVAEEAVSTETTIALEKAPVQAQTTVQTLDDFLARADEAVIDGPVSTSAASFFEETTIADAPEATASETPSESQEIAQVTRPLYRGVSPFYIGVGGNIGIADSDQSGVGDFGFNIISKVSLGPRFSVRPTAQISEDNFSVAIPVTYNFNPLEVKGFSIYPALGGGIDIGDDVGILVNGTIDIPISQQFTVNSQVNWRVSEDGGLGISLGLGYNIPLFFE